MRFVLLELLVIKNNQTKNQKSKFIHFRTSGTSLKGDLDTTINTEETEKDYLLGRPTGPNQGSKTQILHSPVVPEVGPSRRRLPETVDLSEETTLLSTDPTDTRPPRSD